MLNRKLLVVTAVVLTAFMTQQAGFAAEKIKTPKNVIIMIGDGMGYNHIKAADYYQYGEEGKQVYENFPVKYAVATYPAKTGSYGKEQPWSIAYSPYDAWRTFSYLLEGYTESAGAATALTSGKKSYNNSIGMDLDYTKVKNLCEVSKELGKSTGVVTSVPFFDATPAAFVAHNVTRRNYGEIINEMLLESACSVIMGTGNPYYDNDGKPANEKERNFSGAKDLWEQLNKGEGLKFIIDGKERTVADIDNDGKPDPWTFIQDKDDFIKLKAGDTPKRVFGSPRVFASLQSSRGGNANALPFEVPMNSTAPDLSEMSLAALNILGKNNAGFFVMIEGGAIDKAGHANNKGRMIEEMIDFNKAVESVVKWIEERSSWDETLIVVTADHETGYLWGPEKGKFNEIVNNGKGKMPGMEFNSGGHSNSLVAMYAKGAGAELYDIFADQSDSVRGRFMNNTVIANVIKTLYKFK